MTFTGVYAPLPTPFDDRDQVDVRRFEAAMKTWVASPLTGFVVLGTNGEAALMDDEESDRAIATVRQAAPPDRTVLAGTARESTNATIRATKRAAALGADAVLVRTPGFFKAAMTADALVRHYTAVADASPVPVLLYNFTAVTGVDLQPPAVARLAAHPNIVGMKESGGDVARIADLVASVPSEFSVLAGSATTFFPSLMAGASGGILALANVLPEECVTIYTLLRAKRYDEAREVQRRIAPVSKLVGANGVAGLKAALKVVGIDVGDPRPPLASLSDAAAALLRDAIERVKQAERVSA
jgi:4-hydroxy-2-oxoglutarate aldolase